MPSDNFSRPTGPRKKLKRKQPSKPAPRSEAAATGYTKGAKSATGVRGSTNAAGRKASPVKGTAKAKPAKRKTTTPTPIPVANPLTANSALRYLVADKRYQKGLGSATRPISINAGKTVTQVAKDFPKGVIAAGAAASEGIRKLQGETDISKGGVQRLGFDFGGRAARNLPKDAANIVVNTIPATVHLAKTAVHDPGKALKELAQPYVDLAKHPRETLTEKPLTSALLVTGPVRGASRGVGAVARRGKLGKAAKRAASTERKPATVENTKLSEPRQYSPDPVGKAIRVRREKRQLKKIDKANRQADELETKGHYEEAAALRDQAAQQHPSRMTEDQIKRRVDEIVSAREQVRRRHGQVTDVETRAAVRNQPAQARKLSRKERKALKSQKVRPDASLSLIAQNIVHATVEDLRAYLNELERTYEHGDLTARQKALNRQLRGQIERALDKPQDMRLVERAARRYQSEVERPRSEKLVRYRMVDPGEAAKRRELPFAVRHLGAVRDTTPRLTKTGTEKLVLKARRQEAAQRVVEAEKAVASTRTALDRAVADARVIEAKGGNLEHRVLPQRSLAGRKQTARTSSDVKTMLRWIGQAERRAGDVVRSARGKPLGQSVADRVRAADAAHEQAKVVRDQARNDAIVLRKQAKALRKTSKGKPDKQAPGFVDPQGRPLTTEQIRLERRQGAEDAVTGQTTRTPILGEPAYVSHAPNLLKGGSFYRDAARPASIPNKAFTGHSVTKGTLDASEEALRASARRMQSLIDAHEGHLAFIDEMALRDKQGRAITGDRKRVQDAIDKATLDAKGHPRPGAVQFRLVRIHPFGGSNQQLETLLNDLNRHGEIHSNAKGEQNPVVNALEDALAGKGDGPFAAIPEAAAVRIEQHLRVLGSNAGHVWQAINTVWRKNVLAFSTKWAASNVGEGSVRSVIAGVRPGDRPLMKRTLEMWEKEDPQAAEAFRVMLGQGHYGFTRATQRYATAEEFMDPARHGRFVRNAARIAGAINRTPVVNWLPKVWSEWTGLVMDTMGRVEAQFKLGMAGKKVRDLHQGSRLFADLSEKGLREALDGLKGTPTQVQVARFVRDSFGKYEAHSPMMRKWIEMYTPFIAWAKNAAQFLFVILPRDHPVLTAFMADVTSSQEDWLKELGLWIGEHDAVPAHLLGDIPVGDGGLLKTARYTPASLLTDPLGTAASSFAPSLSNILMAAKGLDPFGNKLKESRETAVLKAMLGMALPGPIAQQLQPGAKSILDTINPVESASSSQVQYARAKATDERLQAAIDALSAAVKAKRPDGSYDSTYQALLDEQADLAYAKKAALVEGGKLIDPALPVRRQRQLLKRTIRDLPEAQRGDELQFESKVLDGLKKADRQLAAVQAGLEPPKPKLKKLKPRPLSTREKILKSVEDARKADPRKEILDEVRRLREQAKVDRGQ